LKMPIHAPFEVWAKVGKGNCFYKFIPLGTQ